MVWPGLMRFHSGSIGSFTFTTRLDAAQTASASCAICAPATRYRASLNPLPRPAPVSTMTVCPADTKASAPAGTSETRFSLVLISFGMPIFISFARWPIVEREWYLFSGEGQEINDLLQVAPQAAAK